MSSEVSLKAPPNTPELTAKFHEKRAPQIPALPVPQITVIRPKRISVSHKPLDHSPFSSTSKPPSDERRESSPGVDVRFGAGEIERALLLKGEWAEYFRAKLIHSTPIVIEELSREASEGVLRVLKTGYFPEKIEILYELYAFFLKESWFTLLEKLEGKILGEMDWRNAWLHLKSAHQYIPQKPFYKRLFQMVVHQPAYLWIRLDQLSHRFFLEILQHDQLGVPEESHLLNIIFKWCQIKKIEERPLINKCLDRVRFEMCELEEIPDIRNKEIKPGVTFVTDQKATEIFMGRFMNHKSSMSRRYPRVVSLLDDFQVTSPLKQRQEGDLLFTQSFELTKEKTKILFKINKLTCLFIFQQTKTHSLKFIMGQTLVPNHHCFLWLQFENAAEAPWIHYGLLHDLLFEQKMKTNFPLDREIVRFALTIFETAN